MLGSYNKSYYKQDKIFSDMTELSIVPNAFKLSGLGWNQYIGKFIINDLITKLSAYDGIAFDSCITSVLYIQLGLFQSAIAKISEEDTGASIITDIKTWLISALKEADDR